MMMMMKKTMKHLSNRSKWLLVISLSMSCGILSLHSAQKLAAIARDESPASVTQLRQQLADYKSALATMQNQLTKNQTLLKNMLEQKQALLQSNKHDSLDKDSAQKLKEYEQYITQLENEIESIRRTYLEQAKYQNVLNINTD